MSDGLFLPAARQLHAAGWHPFPLPTGRKFPPPVGVTGAGGEDASLADLFTFAEASPDANVGVRAPEGVLGIDVDHYGGKYGGNTLTKLEKQLGDLPDTWWSTSKTDGVSGIRWFRVPPGLSFADLPYVEMIRRNHRYAVVPPSIHPDGEPYRWRNPDGAWGDVCPPVVDLPDLPTAWVEHLSRPDRARPVDLLDDEHVNAAIGLWPAGEPCQPVRLIAEVHRLEVRQGIHPATKRAVKEIAWRAGAVGHTGGAVALETVRAQFAEAVRAGRGAQRAAGLRLEWQGLKRWAVSRVTSPGRNGVCLCGAVLTSEDVEATNG